MTICIAAECREGDEKIIVLCTDWQLSSALGRTDTKLKARALRRNWWCLTAGTESDIIAAFQLLTKSFKAAERIDETNTPQLVRSAMNTRKKEKIDEFIQGRYAISYDAFLSLGKEKFPADVHREAVMSISDIRLGATFIVAGFEADGYPMILETNDQGRVFIREDFATIGEGAYLAQAALLQREHMSAAPLGRAIYHVYEAKRLAERVSSVGSYTSIFVLKPDGTFHDVSNEGMEFLANSYKRFGPQLIDQSVISKAATFLEVPTLVRDD